MIYILTPNPIKQDTMTDIVHYVWYLLCICYS